MNEAYTQRFPNGTGYARIVATAERCRECGGRKAIGGFWEELCPSCRTRRAALAMRAEARRLDAIAAAGWGDPDASVDPELVDIEDDRWLLERGVA